MKDKAIFLDRDGTINFDPGYLGDPKKLILFADTGKVLSLLKKYYFKLIVISNQSGVARGYITEKDVLAVNAEINERLFKFGVSIDAFYFCPFHPDFNNEEEYNCRKPSPKMILNASKDYNIDLANSYIIGDSVEDIEAGINSGLKTILVKTGYGAESISILQKENKFPNFIAENLTEAGKFIIHDSTGETISV